MLEDSNIDEVVAYLDRWVKSFDFTRPGTDQSLGRDIGHTVVRGPDVGAFGGILGRCADNKGPDGTPWAPNAESTRKRKLKKYGWDEVNRQTGQMLAEQSFQIMVEPELVTIVYGWDVPPDRSVSPTGYISDQDKAVTDRDKARFAHEGGSRGRDIKGRFTKSRPARPFMGWNREDYHNVINVCQASMDTYIRETNAANAV